MGSLEALANETVRITDEGRYLAPSGRSVDLSALIERAMSGTRLVRPGELAPYVPTGAEPTIEVTGETTGEAARRLVEREGVERLVLLNFASAKNPGGGFLGGAKAQEEDLARCSALYRCQLTQPDYYAKNRGEPSMLYTDHLIYSPDVVFFRDEHGALLEAPFCASIITAPAPNAGVALERDAAARPAISATLARRAGLVLELARREGHETLLLGAWGCGVFKNDPVEVAEVFASRIRGFRRVVFAVYDRSRGQQNIAAFRARF